MLLGELLQGASLGFSQAGLLAHVSSYRGLTRFRASANEKRSGCGESFQRFAPELFGSGQLLALQP